MISFISGYYRVPFPLRVPLRRALVQVPCRKAGLIGRADRDVGAYGLSVRLIRGLQAKIWPAAAMVALMSRVERGLDSL